MPPFFLYIRPDEMFQATSVSGAVETGYTPEWLIDGNPGRGVRATSGTVTWTATGPETEVGLVAAINSNINQGLTVTFSLGSSTMLPYAKYPKAPFSYDSTPADVTSVSISVTGNSVPVIVGELVAGKARTLERPVMSGGSRSFQHKNPDRGGLYNSINAYSYGIQTRVHEFSTTASQEGLDAIQEWYDSCDDQAKHTLIVPTPSINQAMFALFTRFSFTKSHQQLFRINMTFEDTVVVW